MKTQWIYSLICKVDHTKDTKKQISLNILWSLYSQSNTQSVYKGSLCHI
jgi:hypothetical protein